MLSKYTRYPHFTIILAVISTFISIFSASSALAFKNATNQDVGAKCNIRYTLGKINWTNPALNTNTGGTFNRIAIGTSTTADPNQPASAFVEVGWLKQASIVLGIPRIFEYINITYTNASGNISGAFITRPQRTVHEFGIQYDRVVNNQWFFSENGQIVLSRGFTSNFIKGCASIAGGEVVAGVEKMGNTNFYSLTRGKFDKLGNAIGGFWISNTTRLHQIPYNCTVLGLNAHRCGP